MPDVPAPDARTSLESAVTEAEDERNAAAVLLEFPTAERPVRPSSHEPGTFGEQVIAIINFHDDTEPDRELRWKRAREKAMGRASLESE